MISKRSVAVGICLSVIVGLVAMPAFADRYRATPEAEAMETPAAEENLIGSAYNRVAGTVYITGKTITGTTKAAGGKVLDTAHAGGKAVVRTHKAGRKTLRGAAEASGRTLGGAAEASGRALGGAAEASGRTLGGAAEASGRALGGAAEATGRTLGGAADAVTGTAGAAYRTVVGGEEPAEEVQIEEIAIEQPKEKGLFAASWDVIAGTAGAIGRTFGAAYASVFPVKEPEAEIEEVEPVEPQARRHRFVPRYHGMVARRVAYRGR